MEIMSLRRSERICRKSYAKINLFLDVLGKREDGYHNIRTIFHEIELADDLKFTLTKSSAIRVLANIDSLCTDQNLVHKVAFFMQQKYQVKCGVEISLTKRIPLGGGLGGGSTNAAVTIQALSELWNLHLTPQEENLLAAMFGSDINFFLKGGLALGTGRGESIQALTPLSIDHILLVNPGYEISAKDAYGWVTKYESHPEAEEKVLAGHLQSCYNALEEAVVVHDERIRQLLEQIKLIGAYKAIMSGSGATCIGFFASELELKHAETYFQERGFWVQRTKTR